MDKVKKVICKNWENNVCKFTIKECNFAHGINDIIKSKCLSGDNCFNELCNYKHSDIWNPGNNKLECNFCIKGFCNKENNKYRHIDLKNNVEEDNKNIIIDIPKDKDFPEIIKSKYTNIKNPINKYSDILKCNLINKDKLKNDEIKENLNEIENKKDENNEIMDIKKRLNNNYILLSRLDHKDWNNYEEIDEIKYEIENLENKYYEIKNTYKKENIYDDNLNLDIIFKDKNTFEEEYIPNIIINNIKVDKLINNQYINKNEDIIEKLIEKMENDFKIYDEKIKQIIKNIVKNDYNKFILINNMNQISSMINLFRNNFKDIKK